MPDPILLPVLSLGEGNPYRPSIPETLRDIIGDSDADFFREQTETLRDQHNKTQAGDTSFPWPILVEVQDRPLYTLGSLGRFWHQDYGVILARYVHFDSMLELANFCVPAGRLRATPAQNWTLTNDVTRSNPDSVVGMIAAYVRPTNGQYGWVIVSGANLSSIENLGTGTRDGEAFCWATAGAVSPTALGRIVGRRVGDQSAPDFPPGTFMIDVESWGLGQIQSLVETALESTNEAIILLQGRTLTLEESMAAVQTQVNTNTAGLDTLTLRVNGEVLARRAGDDSLRSLILGSGFITNDSLTIAINGVRGEINEVDNRLSPRVQTALNEASRAHGRIDGLLIPDGDAIDLELQKLRTKIANALIGAASSTDNALVRWDGVTGKLVKDSTAILNDTGDLTVNSVTVADAAYGAGWNGSLLVPTRNAVYDKIESLTAADIDFTPTGTIAATNVQTAIAEVDSEKVAKITSTNNAVAKYSGTGGALADSGVIIDSSNNVTGVLTLTVGSNIVLNHGTAAVTNNINLGIGSMTHASHTGTDCISIGRTNLLAAVTGNYNIAIGLAVLQAVTAGTDNVGLGRSAAQYQTGSNNLMIGATCGTGVVGTPGTGNHNVGVGSIALFAVQGAGAENTAIGGNCGRDITTGTRNVCVGYNTGRGITTGGKNTIIGANVTGLSATLANNIILADGDGVVRGQCDSAGRWTFSKRIEGVTTNSGDANFTVTPGTNSINYRLTGTITADRTVTLSTTGVADGDKFRFTRTGAGAFNWNIGTGPLKALAVNTWCEVVYDSTAAAWYLAAYGAL